MKVYYIKLNDEDQTGVECISLVASPAVEMNFLCFSEEKPVKLNFDNSQHIISGVVCLADTPIYRHDEKHGDYYVVFTKETIKKMVEKFAKQDLFKSVNLQHNDDSYVEGVYMFESYLIDKERGIVPMEFADVPDGSWIVSYKVENNDLWNEIVNGNKLNGFSLQGFFNFYEKFSKEDDFDNWINQYL